MKENINAQQAFMLAREQFDLLENTLDYLFENQLRLSESLFKTSPPKQEEPLASNIDGLVNAALLSYLFSVWDAYVPSDLDVYVDDDVLEKIEAFKHVRDNAALKFKGWRANFQRRRNAFESQMPFSNIYWNSETDLVDISESSVAKDCYLLMRNTLATLESELESDD